MPKEQRYSVNFDNLVFNEAYFPYLCVGEGSAEPRRIEIFYGGASSGKSYFLADRCVIDVMRGGHNYLVTRKIRKTARRTCFAQIRQSISKMGVSHLFKIREQEMDFTCVNGYQIYIEGLDDYEKIKSIVPLHGNVTDVWCEEATELNEADYQQLNLRLRGDMHYDGKEVFKRIVFSFNPIYTGHWIYKRFFEGFFSNSDRMRERQRIRILKTTYKDNAFLTDQDREEIENAPEGYWYDVYALGNWGVLGDVIFTNWRTDDLTDMRNSASYHWNGMDFGYSNDPTAMVRAIKQDNVIYVTDMPIYEKKLTNYDIAERLQKIIGSELVRCDTEPKSIEELKLHGINAVPAVKGRDSVLHGIQFLQQHEIVIHKELQDLINEFETYQWHKDIDGNSLNRPQDKNNHGIDALRYAFSGSTSTKRFANCSWM